MEMKRMIKSLLLLAVIAAPVWASAQEWDDIYYNPSKDKKTKAKSDKKTQQVVEPADFVAAGSYSGTWNTQNLRSDDEYNRRYQVVDTLAVDSMADESQNFTYTRRIERFHNPDVVVETGNEDLVDWYYNQQETPQSVVVINVENNPWNWYPYGYRSWFRPYGLYSSYWGPTWGFGLGYDPWFYWGYDPWYSWGWGPSYGWGWTSGPSWGHGPAWGWNPGSGRPVAGSWHPSSPGASRPHGSSVTSGHGHYAAGSAISRPGNMGRPSATSSGSKLSSSAWMRPGNSGSASSSRNHTTNSTVSRPGNSGNYTPSHNNSSSSSRWNNNSSSRNSYNSGSSYSGGSHRGGAGSSMGGGRGSYGGGGSRGGRR